MKIVVAIKQVPIFDEQFEFNGDGIGIDPASVDWEPNEWDLFSLEEAVQIKEGATAGEVIVVTVDDKSADEMLVTCLAKGADRAVRVWGNGLGGADALGVARVLAEVVRREQPDLVFCGAQSSDWPSGATGTAVAALADLSRVAVVKSIALSGAEVTVERELEGGLIEFRRLSTPALLTVQTGLNEPRYANFRAKKQALNKPITVLSLDELGLDEDSVAATTGCRVIALTPPEQGASAQMIPGDALAVAERIRTILRESGVTP